MEIPEPPLSPPKEKYKFCVADLGNFNADSDQIFFLSMKYRVEIPNCGLKQHALNFAGGAGSKTLNNCWIGVLKTQTIT